MSSSTPRRVLAALRGAVLLLALTVLAHASAASAQTGTLQEITGFGQNPSQLRMYVYRPLAPKAKPPIVVAVHWCHGDGMAMYNGSEYARLADRYGYIAIYPSVTQASDGCFDVASTATLTHGGGSDSLGIVSMVQYALKTYGGDASRVYVTGVSSGAMMTNVLLGAYPDVFQAGAAFAGVPFGCFAGPYSWSADCATGKVTHTPAEWGDLARAAYPGYTGPRPRMQLWHGTADEVLSYVDFGEEIEQWTNVLGVSQTPVTTEQNTPQSGWTRTRYGSAGEGAAVEAISMANVVHNLPVQYAAAIHFFGLDVTTPDTQAPTAPLGLACPSKTDTSVSLTWTASTDDVAVTGYDVYGDGALVASVAAPGAAVGGLTPSTTYQFTVRARDAAGNVSASSAALTVSTAAPVVDVTPPSAPGTPVASGVTSSGVTLTWTASADAVGVVGYDVYQQTSAGAVRVASTAGTSATLSGLASSTRYTFSVKARDGAGNVSPASPGVTVSTLAGGAGGCVVHYAIQSQWNPGFTASVTITNTGATAVNGWSLGWTFPDGQTIAQSWNATATAGTSTVTARSMSYNAVIPAGGGSVSFGFIGAWAGTGTNGVPAAFTLDGVACTRD
jgi:poly(hydroxyalkanoate) depolymerase family esterase